MGEENNPTTGIEHRNDGDKSGGGGGHDIISKMPDEILLHILSSSSVRDAARTGVLSTRWKALWKCLPVLDLPIHAFDDRRKLLLKSNKYCEIVSAIMLQRPPNCAVTRFRVSAPLGEEERPHIDSWIGFVAASGAKHIGLALLDLNSHRVEKKGQKSYTFPYHSWNTPSLESLDLWRVRMEQLPEDFKGFSSIKHLCLRKIDLDERLRVQDVLSACPVLESLRIYLDTCGSSDAACMRIFHSRLKCLVVYGVDSDAVEISCASLIKFEFATSIRQTRLDFVDESPLMSTLLYTPCRPESTCKFLLSIARKAPNIENLRLRLYGPHDKVNFLPLLYGKGFNKMKQLEISVSVRPDMDLLSMLLLLAAAPHLEKFSLYLLQPSSSHRHSGNLINRYTIFSHAHLEHIEIQGFCGCTGQIEFASCILKRATALKTMTVSCYRDEKRHQQGLEIDDSRRIAAQLRLDLPPNIKLSIA